jgi:DinB superfamily
MTGTPRSGAELGNALGAQLSSGIAQLLPLSDTAFFAAQGRFWSPAEHVRHLTKSATPLVMALGLPRWLLRLRFGPPGAPSRSFSAMTALYLERLSAGATAGRFTPTPEAVPADLLARRQEIIAGWTRATVGLQNAIARWPEASLDSYQLPHPVLGMLTVREMLFFTVYHTSHHLRRIAERSAPVPA